LEDFEKSYKSLLQLNTIPIFVTHQIDFDQKFFPHRFSVIYDKNQEFYENFGVLNRNSTFMLQNMEIVNFYISTENSTSSINFWRIVIDPDGTSKIRKRNIQGRTSIHIQSPFNNTNKSRNIETRTSIHIPSPFSDGYSQNEKYEQNIEESVSHSFSGFDMDSGYLGKMVSQRRNKTEMRTQPQEEETIQLEEETSSSKGSTLGDFNFSFVPSPILPSPNCLSPRYNDEEFNEYLKSNLKLVRSTSDLFGENSQRTRMRNFSIMDNSKVNSYEVRRFDLDRKNQKESQSLYHYETEKKHSNKLKIEIETPTEKKSLSNLFGMVKNKSKKEKKEAFEYMDIYKNERYFQFFKLFLATEFSLENALFLESVHEFVEAPQEKRKLICQKIFDEFFEANSLKEINISNAVKQSIREKFDDEEFPDDLFEKIVLELQVGIMQDSFFRFTLSPYFEDMFSKKKI
jgi:hypothetical protein